jgi:nitroreductase
MELSTAIKQRRTIKDFNQQSVPDELLNQALEAGLWAQNHRLTQPWRFTILGPVIKETLATSFPKIRDKPIVVAVSCLRSDGGEQEREDYAAVACAIQNIQLQAWALGLGMQWSSGKMATGSHLYELLEINPEKEFMVGLLFFGFPSEIPAPKPRKPLAEVLKRVT